MFFAERSLPGPMSGVCSKDTGRNEAYHDSAELIYRKLESREGIASLLTLDDFSPVYRLADRVRKEAVGDIVHLRAIIEFSNVCRRQCRYCGLNRDNRDIPRYRMSREEILESAEAAVKAGYRTIVLQSGEDEYFTAERLADIIGEIKKMEARPGRVAGTEMDEVSGTDPSQAAYAGCGPPLHPAVTVSCGERPREDYQVWRRAGADRYLLKHETADPELYDQLHPCGTLEERVKCLRTLKELGYETGSGFMVGLPGQTPLTLAKDLQLLKEIPCKMAGIGPFISNPKTPLAGEPNGDPELARRAVAIARLMLPEANLPLTTSLSILSVKEKAADAAGNLHDMKDEKTATGKKARPAASGDALPAENPFAFGANVVMKKVTPDEYKEAYEIYPAQFKETDVEGDRQELEMLIGSCGREPL